MLRAAFGGSSISGHHGAGFIPCHYGPYVDNNDSNSPYSLVSGSSIHYANEYVGNPTTGIFNQSGGTNTVSADFYENLYLGFDYQQQRHLQP